MNRKGSLARGMRLSGVILLVSLMIGVAGAATVHDSAHYVAHSSDFVELTASDGLAIDLKYATIDNFVGQNMYGDFNKAYLHHIAAEKLRQAISNLKRIHPAYKLVIYDALRPRSVQYVLWDKVKGTNKQKYVANPRHGSIHNFGFAVDLSILDENGKALNMGTPFDAFTDLAQPRLEQAFLREGKLTQEQINNRLLLRKVMEDAGFIQLPVEWWHYDALPKAKVMSEFKIIE
jgi:D-alanyl-D-alanine dipeptidase